MKFGVNTELAKSLRLTIHFTILVKIKFNICKHLLWFQLFETEFHRWFGIPSISSRHSWSSRGFRIQRVHLLATTCSWYAWWRRSCQIHRCLFRFKQAASSSGDEKWTLGIRFSNPPHPHVIYENSFWSWLSLYFSYLRLESPSFLFVSCLRIV